MNAEERELRWARLIALLEPVHGPALATSRRLARTRADGDDLYAEAVLRAFEKLHTLRDESRFRPWFFATLLSRHRSRSRVRFWRRFVSLDEAFPAGAEPVGADGTRWADDAWRAERVAAGLGALPAVQREAIVLFELDGYSIEEIAAMQRVSISAVKSRLTRGRERLRCFYERHGAGKRAAAGADRDGIVREFGPPNVGASTHAHPRVAVLAATGLEQEDGRHD
jgi:RNA polymerase sigma-70 factor (ECF subfamily)